MNRPFLFRITRHLSSIIILGCTMLHPSCQPGNADNWLQVPIQACIDSNTRIVEESAPVLQYCECLIPKVVEAVKGDRGKMLLLKKGDLKFLITTTDPALFAISKECMPSERPGDKTKKLAEVFDARIEKGIRLGLENHHDETFKSTHDFQEYCDCYLNGLKNNFTEEEYNSRDFPSSEKYTQLKANCEEKSRK